MKAPTAKRLFLLVHLPPVKTEVVVPTLMVDSHTNVPVLIDTKAPTAKRLFLLVHLPPVKTEVVAPTLTVDSHTNVPALSDMKAPIVKLSSFLVNQTHARMEVPARITWMQLTPAHVMKDTLVTTAKLILLAAVTWPNAFP